MWDQAEQLCVSAGLDYRDNLNYYLHNGYIFSTPKSLIWAEPFISDEMQSWLVFLAIGKGSIPIFLNAMPFWLPYFSFARLLRKRHNLCTYPMERLCNLYGISTETLKSRR